MANINTSASGHAGPAALAGGHQYLSYSDAHFLATLRRAMHTLQSRIRGQAPCDNAFRSLPGGRTFSQVRADPAVWINFDPSRRGGDYGATRGKEITITAYSLSMGPWTVAATLVHELAHVNGASGSTHDAEATLRSCLLRGLENPAIIGRIIQASRVQVA
ncbi:MAG: hypothetical protein ACR2NN_11325 [Bryobacteraceae bacterium]